jgi:hypothetical protein
MTSAVKPWGTTDGLGTFGESYFTVFLGSPLDEVEHELIRRTIAFADGNKA